MKLQEECEPAAKRAKKQKQTRKSRGKELQNEEEASVTASKTKSTGRKVVKTIYDHSLILCPYSEFISTALSFYENNTLLPTITIAETALLPTTKSRM